MHYQYAIRNAMKKLAADELGTEDIKMRPIERNNTGYATEMICAGNAYSMQAEEEIPLEGTIRMYRETRMGDLDMGVSASYWVDETGFHAEVNGTSVDTNIFSSNEE